MTKKEFYDALAKVPATWEIRDGMIRVKEPRVFGQPGLCPIEAVGAHKARLDLLNRLPLDVTVRRLGLGPNTSSAIIDAADGDQNGVRQALLQACQLPPE